MSNNTSSGGIGFVGLLTIVFITLKLTEYIDWSWWWVLSPIWISFSIVVLIAVLVGVFAAYTNSKVTISRRGRLR